ncbi:MAG TPA: hypothetical protein VKU41_22655 [Polyangiaceae bacterium]|nr:hypothetical protein [Polyangiaceae bacterium]
MRTRKEGNALALAALVAWSMQCSGSSSSPSPGDGGGDAVTAGDASGSSSGDGGPQDAGGAGDVSALEAAPIDYYVGGCRFGGNSGAVPADAGLLHGLTVIAQGVQASAGLEVDATNAYFAATDSIQRIPLSGGTPTVMVSGASPAGMALAGGSLIWSDGTVPMQTRILSAPLTAVGWAVPGSPGDGGADAESTDGSAIDAGGDGAPRPAPTILATLSGSPGAFAVTGGYAYFAADATIARVPLAGGAVDVIAQGLGPTGIAAGPAVVYLGDGDNEVIDQAMIGVPDGGPIGLFAQSGGTPTQLAIGNGGTDLYWGDWFGGIDHCPIAMPYHVDVFGTPCGGGACYPRHVRAGGPGVVWESGDNICGTVGTAGPAGSTYLATGIAAVQAVAVDGQHLYASTVLGELLRLDL